MIQKVIKKIHFVGIGGIGMSGIAEIMLNQGFQISGSDLSNTEITESLKAKGVTIYEGHSADNVKDADVLVYSSVLRRRLCIERLGCLWCSFGSGHGC